MAGFTASGVSPAPSRTVLLSGFVGRRHPADRRITNPPALGFTVAAGEHPAAQRTVRLTGFTAAGQATTEFLGPPREPFGCRGSRLCWRRAGGVQVDPFDRDFGCRRRDRRGLAHDQTVRIHMEWWSRQRATPDHPADWLDGHRPINYPIGGFRCVPGYSVSRSCWRRSRLPVNRSSDDDYPRGAGERDQAGSRGTEDQSAVISTAKRLSPRLPARCPV